MKKLITATFLLLCITAFAQKTSHKAAWLEKWNNSKEYLIAIAQAMPATAYDFKPADREMSFKAQLQHIQGNMNWLGSEYFRMPANRQSEGDVSLSKEEVILQLRLSFENVHDAIAATKEKDFKTTVEFFAGSKSKYQILNLLQDHVTHHRGQLVVYLNMNDVTPPAYVGW